MIWSTDELCDLPERQSDHRPEDKGHTWTKVRRRCTGRSSWLTHLFFLSPPVRLWPPSAAPCRRLVGSTLLLIPLFGLHYAVFALFPEHVGVRPRLDFELVLGSFQVTDLLCCSFIQMKRYLGYNLTNLFIIVHSPVRCLQTAYFVWEMVKNPKRNP